MINKVVWNLASQYSPCDAKVGEPLKEIRDIVMTIVTSIVWAEEEDGSIFINMSDKTQIQVMHPDEVHYAPVTK